jgi:methyl-galactoside transport system ATP-binding protein/inositol transport system ATP-binding protein
MGEHGYLLEITDVVKLFQGVRALSGVSMNVRAGEVHALVGENGAGKSTLMKCLIGLQQPTSGTIYFDGAERQIKNTAQALNIGISMIHQELCPVLHRSIMENIWLGREPRNRLGLVDHKKMHDKTKELLASVEVYDDPKTLMRDLTVAKMQMIEITKAISYDAKLIIMDEPTSSLTSKEVEHLFRIIQQLRQKNIAIIYISHKMEEIFKITDRITIFRDGAYIATRNTGEVSMDEVIRLMVGRDLNEMYVKKPVEPGEVLLEVEGLSCGNLFANVSFSVRSGEILGIAGLVGAGRTEVLETIFGMRPKTTGKVYIKGREIHFKSPKDAIQNGIALLTEDRRSSGIFEVLSVSYNIAVANMDSYVRKNGLLDQKKIDADCERYQKKIRIKASGMSQQIQYLSGGNQQKALIARWLLTDPHVLLLDEPTRGIDIGAKAEIYKLIEELAKAGKSIIMVSSELSEVIGMSDRILVMHEGRVTDVLENRDGFSQERIMAFATDGVATCQTGGD